jgi:hypothetical protein
MAETRNQNRQESESMNTEPTQQQPAPAPVRVQPVVSCRVCQTPTEPENLTHLKIYVAGSEGVDVCLTCRKVLTEVLRGMMSANFAGRKQGYIAAKQVAAAKAANP